MQQLYSYDAYWTTCRYVNSWTTQFADWTAHGLVNLQTGLLVDAASSH